MENKENSTFVKVNVDTTPSNLMTCGASSSSLCNEPPKGGNE